MSLNKIYAFLKKDFLIHLSYKFAFLFHWMGIFISVATFYFISKLFGQATNPYLVNYGGEYFSFVLIGVASSAYLSAALHSLSSNLRNEQILGTLEAILVTPTKLPLVIFSMNIWNFLLTSVDVLIYLAFGTILFGAIIQYQNFLWAIFILLLTIISFSGIGMVSAAFIMVLKRGDPVTALVSISSTLLGGVYFPVEIMPKTLQVIAGLLPITYSLRLLRRILLQGSPLFIKDTLMLLLFCLILFPLGLISFNYAIRRVKAEGSLAHY